MSITFVMGDREPAANHLAATCARWHLNKGFKVLVASSYPENILAEIYSDPVFRADGVTVLSVDATPGLGFDPKIHGPSQIHRRIAFAVRLGGAYQAFRMGADAVVCGDSDVFLLERPEEVLTRLGQAPWASNTLPFPVPEAPNGWVNDLGMVLSREAMKGALAASLENLDRVRSVHGLLAEVLPDFGRVKMPPLAGMYLFPQSRDQPMHLAPGMPMDAWVNSGCVVGTPDGKPLFAHLCLKTQRSDLPSDHWLAWALQQLDRASDMECLATLSDRLYFPSDWEKRQSSDILCLKQAGIADPGLAFWQNPRAIQDAAAALRAGKAIPLPTLQPDWAKGTVEPLPATLGEILGTL